MRSLSRAPLVSIVLVLVLVVVLVIMLGAALTWFLVLSPRLFGLILGGAAVVAMIVSGVQIALSGAGARRRPERDRASAHVDGAPVRVVTVLGPAKHHGDR